MSDFELKKKKIFEINSLDIPQIEKSKLIFKIMNPNFEEKIKIPEKKRIECKHYNKYNYILSKCCNKIYPCRLCHDENEDHKINRYDIDYMKCDFCKCLQKKNICCKNPNCFKFNSNHENYCDKCNLWNNDLDKNLVFLNSILIKDISTYKKIFHCDDCNICRIGNKEDYQHCKDCNLCVSKKIYENHTCKINMKEKNCPICLKSVWNEFQKNPIILKCGHSMHSTCLNQALTNGNYFCPICKKSIIDLTQYWNQIEEALELQTMPEEYQNWESEIYCNDCELKSTTKYHFIYHKCNNCNGFNTILENIKK